MLSRVADALYWMNRYVERAENIARFVDVNLHLMIDLADVREQWQPLVAVTGDAAWFAERYGAATRENVMDFLVFNRDYPHSIVSCLRAARENARTIREIISSEMWELINKFYLFAKDAAGKDGNGVRTPNEFFAGVKMHSHLLTGLSEDTLSHNEAWHFCRLGRLLERADKTSRILDVKYFYLLPSVQDVGSPLDELQWAAVLRSASGFEMYRKKHGRINPALVAAFLVLDREFPRAILSCLLRAQDSLHAISGSPAGAFTNPAEQRLGQLSAELAFTHPQGLMDKGLHESLDQFQTRLNLVGDAVFTTYLALRAPSPESSHDLLSQRQG